jgi:peptidoglycan/xylan/chitin deacetylase (PgdA/CDA1 family)
MEKQLISLTFDGGWLSQFENALPFLEDYKLPGTFYIVVNNMKSGGLLYMKPNQVKIISGLNHEISSFDHEIGSNGLNRSLFPYYLWFKKEKDIRKSKEVLESLTGKEVKSFAYPYGGRFNKQIIKMVSDAGYKNARTTENHFYGEFPGFNPHTVNPFKISCKVVRKDTTIEDVKSWIITAQGYDLWLILNFHQVVKNPYSLGCKPEFFEEVCKLLNSAHVQVENVSKGFEMFSAATK